MLLPSMKKVLVLSSSDIHGASEAAYRISKFAMDAGFDVRMLVEKKTRADEFIIQKSPEILTGVNRLLAIPGKILKRLKINRAGKAFKPKTHPKYIFFAEEKIKYISGQRVLDIVNFIPDLIIACVTYNLVNTQTLLELKQLTNARILIVTMDMIPLTGGCHYAWDCTGYQFDCKNCPAIIDDKYKDWAHQDLMIKHKNIKAAGIEILAASGWTLQQSKASFLFKDQKKIFNINSMIDTTLFNNANRNAAKNIFGIPANLKTIFIIGGLTDVRKGMIYAIEAINLVWHKIDPDLRDDICVLTVKKEVDIESATSENLLFKSHYIDYVKDYRLLSLVYQAADVFLSPSIEDSGPMMVSEALACGTPVVAFEMGVASNMVINGYNGFKAELKNSEQLAEGLEKVLTLTDEDFKQFSDNAVLQVEQFSSQKTVVEVLNELLPN